MKVAWELFDRDLPAGAPSVFLLPTWAIIHSRFWKGQVPDLARRFRVLTMDNRGNGRSDRPTELAQMTLAQTIADRIAVMDATETRAAVLVGLSMGGAYALRLAALHPERVVGAILVDPVRMNLIIRDFVTRVTGPRQGSSHRPSASAGRGDP